MAELHYENAVPCAVSWLLLMGLYRHQKSDLKSEEGVVLLQNGKKKKYVYFRAERSNRTQNHFEHF